MAKGSVGAEDFLQLRDKVVIITGASTGIGEAAALEFARHGCYLMLCGRNQERLEAVATSCFKISRKAVKAVVGDIVKASVQREIIDKTIQHFGRIDILVNNAGINKLGTCQSARREDFQAILKTNLESVFFLTQLAIPYINKSKGNIVNLSSISSEQQQHKIATYSMSKAALDSFTKSLAMELAPSGVRVNSVNPATVITQLYQREGMDFSEEKMTRFAKSQCEIHPLGRLVELQEVADAIVYLASCRSSAVTGQMVFVANGRQCSYPQAKL